MQPFTVLSGAAAALPAANVDTDVIMPKQFLKGVDRRGLAQGVFHNLRFDETGAERPDFVLNRPAWRGASILVVGSNFGCGSSREHAVWGLMQLGVRALVGTTYAGIFFDNCARNGLLAISLQPEEIERLMGLAGAAETCRLQIDLAAQAIISADGRSTAFPIDAVRKAALMSGLDAVGQTLRGKEDIRTFEQAHFARYPWLG